MSAFLAQIEHIPRLGFGVGLKDTYFKEILNHSETVDLAEQIDWLEMIPENYMAKGGHSTYILDSLMEAGFSMASHGVNLSLGSVDDLNTAYLEDLDNLFQAVQPIWFSDHLSFSSVNGQYFNDLMPLPFSQEAISICVNKIKIIKSKFPYPFLIENISYYSHFTAEHFLEEAEFLTSILQQADCGLLLDVNNVFVNSKNHHYDPFAFMQALPLERVVEIHMAGHLETDDMIIDTHGEPLRQEVLDLFRWVYPRCPNLKGVLLERDTNLPPFNELMQELQSIRIAAYQSELSMAGRL
jgi:uncharacterized protein